MFDRILNTPMMSSCDNVLGTREGRNEEDIINNINFPTQLDLMSIITRNNFHDMVDTFINHLITNFWR